MKKGDTTIAKKNGYMDDGTPFCFVCKPYIIKELMNDYIVIYSEYSSYHKCTMNFFNKYFKTTRLSDKLFEI